MNTQKEMIVKRLESVCSEGFSIQKISEEAFRIYHDVSISLDEDVDMKLLCLMAMEQGPEFEMTELEYKNFLEDIK